MYQTLSDCLAGLKRYVAEGKMQTAHGAIISIMALRGDYDRDRTYQFLYERMGLERTAWDFIWAESDRRIAYNTEHKVFEKLLAQHKRRVRRARRLGLRPRRITPGMFLKIIKKAQEIRGVTDEDIRLACARDASPDEFRRMVGFTVGHSLAWRKWSTAYIREKIGCDQAAAETMLDELEESQYPLCEVIIDPA
jgi:hypothetical protein